MRRTSQQPHPDVYAADLSRRLNAALRAVDDSLRAHHQNRQLADVLLDVRNILQPQEA